MILRGASPTGNNRHTMIMTRAPIVEMDFFSRVLQVILVDGFTVDSSFLQQAHDSRPEGPGCIAIR
jgi:hypothetical protein